MEEVFVFVKDFELGFWGIWEFYLFYVCFFEFFFAFFGYFGLGIFFFVFVLVVCSVWILVFKKRISLEIGMRDYFEMELVGVSFIWFRGGV